MGFVLEDVAQLIDTFKQAVLGKGVDGEMDGVATGQGEGLRREIDGDGSRRVSGEGKEAGVVSFGDNDGEEPVFECVVFEDVGEGRRDNGAKTELGERPRGVFAG